MGTSSMYNGYSNGGDNKNPLIPDDFEDVDIDETDSEAGQEIDIEEQEQDSNDTELDESKNISVEWRSAKSFMSRVASGNSKNLGGAISNYVKAYGGAKSATRNATGGVKTTVNLGNFISGIAEQGVRETLDSYQIDYKDKTTKEVLSLLINILSPSPKTKEDAISRKAMVLTMEALYEFIDSDDLGIDSLDDLDINVIIPSYIEAYIYEKLINDLGSRIEENSQSALDAINLEKEIKEYIHSKIEVVFKGIDFQSYEFSNKNILKIYNQCYTVIEDLI